MTAIIALLPGQVAAYALKKLETGQIIFGERYFKVQGDEGAGMRYHRYESWLARVDAEAGGIKYAIFKDQTGFKTLKNSHAYGGFKAHMQRFLDLKCIPYLPCDARYVYRGYGKNIEKKIHEAGIPTRTRNEAEAVALLLNFERDPDYSYLFKPTGV